MQLELDPLERVRRLTPPGAPDIAAALSELAGAGVVPGLIIGDVAGALHGWPLALGWRLRRRPEPSRQLD